VLARTGNFFLPVAAAVAQLVPYLFVIPAAFFVQNNAEFTKAQAPKAVLATLIASLASIVLLLLWVYFTYRLPRERINHWLRGETLPSGTDDEVRAWQEITALPWQYAIAAAIAFILVVIAPLLAYLHFGLKASGDQLLYTLIGGVIAASVIVSLGVLIIERLLTPAHEILLPARSETQLSGAAGAKIFTKLQVIIFFVILISVLLVAPIGYHLMVTVLFNGIIGPAGALRTLQLQTILVGIVTLALGFGLSLLLSRSVSDPLRRLIGIFNKVEQGDLKQRANVVSADEVGELTVHFNHMIARLDELTGNLEKQVAERTEQLSATVEVGRVASSTLNPDEMIHQVVNLITDRFGYYYAAFFIIDPTGRWGDLKDATGQAGQTLLAQGHRLEVGGKSMVGTAMLTKSARVALDVGQEPVRFNNPLLPETRSEIALPLLAGDRVIGALDVQSTKEAAFGTESITVLQGMANQVAIALENARLFQEAQKNLEELRATQRLYISEAWSETAQEHGSFEFVSGSESPAPTQRAAALNVPLTLREQIIGQLRLEGLQSWTPEERGLIEAVATQASLALENARLIEESQQVALRERLVAEITGKIWSSPNMDIILQTTVKELGRALRADDATIEMKLE
jgi:GAF domain-containing protein/HAMP domain-containing protein